MIIAPVGSRAARVRSSSRRKSAAVSPEATPISSAAVAPAQPAGEPAFLPVATPSAPARRARADGRAPTLSLVPTPAAARGAMTDRIADFLAREQPATPCLVVDLNVVESNYLGLAQALAPAQIYYAVKANPEDAILRLLAARGSNFDVASRGEIEICLAAGIPATRLSFGNTIKKAGDIAYAYQRGVTLFAFDSEAELMKIAELAARRLGLLPRVGGRRGRRVAAVAQVRLQPPPWRSSSSWRPSARGMNAAGVSFHIGSQQTDLTQWDQVLENIARLYAELAAEGLEPWLVNLGGGYPARYQRDVPAVEQYGHAVIGAVARHFRGRMPQLIVEPGRGMVGDAGVIESEVVLVSTKDHGETTRWVYLDIGKFSGLAETMDEAIKYRFRTKMDGRKAGPVIMAGPTCDSADILYEKTLYQMPLDLSLRPGDKVRILSCGAYTTTYSSVGFNGFPPLKAYSQPIPRPAPWRWLARSAARSRAHLARHPSLPS